MTSKPAGSWAPHSPPALCEAAECTEGARPRTERVWRGRPWWAPEGCGVRKGFHSRYRSWIRDTVLKRCHCPGMTSFSGPTQLFTVIALVSLPAVMFGGYSLLGLLG